MRLFLILAGLTSAACAAVPPELSAALAAFRGDPPRGWSFTQTTAAEGRSTVERCDAAKPEFDRWTLLKKDGREPTPAETREYAEMRSRRSRGGTAPKLTDQFDLNTLAIIRETDDHATYQLRLKPGEKGDKTAEFLRATVVIHKPSRTIESLELASAGEFHPTVGVTMVTTRLRGRAFFFKSLDADMTVAFSDYERVGKN
jgi:hypothetical protein